MSEIDELPEFYIAEGNRRVAAPTYEALMPCQLIMTSAETGVTGPTRVEAGEQFTSEGIPNHYWAPLNRAAGERIEAWLASLPSEGKGFTQEELTEAAFAMRPREGEKEIPHDQWWPAVLRYAGAIKEKRLGSQSRIPQVSTQHRRGGPNIPVMPNMASGPVIPTEIGRVPVQQAPSVIAQAPANSARRTRQSAKTPTPMPGTVASDSPASATG